MKKNKNAESVNDVLFGQKVSKRKKQKKPSERKEGGSSDPSLMENMDDDYSDLSYYRDIYSSMRDW